MCFERINDTIGMSKVTKAHFLRFKNVFNTSKVWNSICGKLANYSFDLEKLKDYYGLINSIFISRFHITCLLLESITEAFHRLLAVL